MISQKFVDSLFHNFAERRTERKYKKICDDILIAAIGWVLKIMVFSLHDSDTQLKYQISEMQENFYEPLNIVISFRYLWYISRHSYVTKIPITLK